MFVKTFQKFHQEKRILLFRFFSCQQQPFYAILAVAKPDGPLSASDKPGMNVYEERRTFHE